MSDEQHQFGGPWTQKKLACLDKYLAAYLTALKNQRFKKGYIDAFAGTPERIDSPQDGGQGAVSIFEDFDEDTKQYLEGSASIALSQNFDGYIFIEKRKTYAEQLERLKQEHPSKRIQVRQGDANEELIKLTKIDWSNRRAVVFLDPYGMQVNWSTMEAIAETKAMDVWMLIPLGIAINRLMPRDANITEGNRNALNNYFGTDEWFDLLYKAKEENTLFGGPKITLEKPTLDEIQDYIVERLKDIFTAVATPLPLYNRGGGLLYLFCFAASGNKRAAEIACRIASSIIESSR